MAIMRWGAICGAVLAAGAGGPVHAQTAGGSYIGSIELLSGAYCPDGMLEADGQSLPIVQYQALFSLILTTYGGDGQTLFNLPDLRGKEPAAGMRYCIVFDGYYPTKS